MNKDDLQKLNEAKDPRHYLPTNAKGPNEELVLDVVRCEGCLRLITHWEAQKLGRCPGRAYQRCGSLRVRGASPTPMEWVWLWWQGYILRSWRVWGPRGRGWEAAR